MAFDRAAFWHDVPWPSLEVHTTALTNDPWPTPGAKVMELGFNSAPHAGQPVRIFGLCALQPDPASHPNVLLLHGGGGYARSPFGSRRLKYFNAGYNVFSIDMPGKGEQRDESRSTGPDMDSPTIWRTGRAGYFYHAVQACRRAFDAAVAFGCTHRTILIEGWSWGAVVALLTASVEPRVRGALAVYGAGHLVRGRVTSGIRALPADAQELWRQQFDPAWQTYPPDVDLYLIVASNDQYFALPDNVATWRRLPRGHAHLAIVPNKNHQWTEPFSDSVDVWIRSRAADRRANAAEVTAVEVQAETVKLLCQGPVREVEVGVARIPDPATAEWSNVTWSIHQATLRDQQAILPLSIIGGDGGDGRLWFANVGSATGFIASTGLYRGQEPLDPPVT